MKRFIKNYKSTLLLLLSIIIGTFIGLIFKEKTNVIKPLGDLFLNLLLISIVPLIFVSITLSISKMKQPKRITKILLSIIIVFVLTSLINVMIGIISTKSFKLVDFNNKITYTLNEEKQNNINILDNIVSTISVNDFNKLLSKDNMIALIVFSIIIGLSINRIKDNNKIINFLEKINDIIHEYLSIIMIYAPIGLGCYYASLIGTFGNEIALGYGRTFIIYTIVSLFVYFFVYSLYVFLAGGKKLLKTYWKNIIPSSLTALATCSSAASMPVNQECTKKMGVSEDVVDTSIALGTNFHKDGSIIGSVFKIIFLVNMFDLNPSLFKIIIIALIATLLVSAVPIGGGTISESLIISMLGLNMSCLGILTIIATIIDPPATLLNVVGDSSTCILIEKLVNKKRNK